ncbi:hypothetical protein ACGFIE_14035 [Micromonospora sp. NPDC049275]|uniref:hypothetical protein n=1 Tax=Micromonospora sp. NPDC049275 TaxID=3364268 RepID=UPI00371C8EAA
MTSRVWCRRSPSRPPLATARIASSWSGTSTRCIKHHEVPELQPTSYQPCVFADLGQFPFGTETVQDLINIADGAGVVAASRPAVVVTSRLLAGELLGQRVGMPSLLDQHKFSDIAVSGRLGDRDIGEVVWIKPLVGR